MGGEIDGAEPHSAGRPPATTQDALSALALDLFLEHGFDETSVDDIAVAAGISRRTFFRYFPSKSAVLWHELDGEIETLRALLAAADVDQPMMEVIHDTVLAINRARINGVRELRARTTLISRVPALQGPAALHYAQWADVIGEFVALRIGVAEHSLFPVTVGRAVLSSATAAYDVWIARGDRSLVAYLDEALGALADAFDEDALRGRAAQRPFTRRAGRPAD